MIDRRGLIGRGLGAAAGVALTGSAARALAHGFATPRPPLVPLLAHPDRMFAVTVCLRPFRAVGPRIEAERIGTKHVVHHYGHGGSGWSLSWGSAREAVPLALAAGETEIAVIGAGAIGLTTAITAQRMGARVTIYAKDRFPHVRSSRATGTWSPDSRIAMRGETGADFPERWERMARAAFPMHLGYLGLAGHPVEWSDHYYLSDAPLEEMPLAATDVPSEAATVADGPNGPDGAAPHGARRFLNLEKRIADLTPKPRLLGHDEHPFPVPHAQRYASLTFNIADLSRRLEQEFQIAGGRFVPMTLDTPADLARIRETTIVNCTGYGARALFGDDSVIPVRGQIAWLIPQEGLTYGVEHDALYIVARRDGIAVQPIGSDHFFGFDDDNEQPDLAAARAGIEAAAALFKITDRKAE